MKSLRISSHFALLASLLLATHFGFATGNRTPPTTFEQLYSASDLIARITITDLRYEHIDYQSDDGSTGKGLATVYTFDVVDEIKRGSPDLPDEFVSPGGKHKDGSESVWSNQAYFQIGDELLVHLIRNPRFLGKLQTYDIKPHGHRGSTFAIHETEQEIRITPYLRRTNEPPAQAMRTSLHPDDPVISNDSNLSDYAELRDLYQRLGTERGETRESLTKSARSAHPSHAQVDFDPVTTFKDLFSRSDLVARILIKSQRYEEIEYLDSYDRKQQTLATIYSFEILDGMKVDPELPNELVSIGGEHPNGDREFMTHTTYFEVGDDVLVHLEQNSLLFDRLDPMGVQPGGSTASTFKVHKTDQGLQLVPYSMQSLPEADLSLRRTPTPDGAVMSVDSPALDYDELKNLYIALQGEAADGQ